MDIEPIAGGLRGNGPQRESASAQARRAGDVALGPVHVMIAPARENSESGAMSDSAGAERLTVSGIELEILRRGAGRPLLLLHGFDTVSPKAPFLDLLGRDAEIIAPSMPGFGNSPRPADFDTMYDLVRFCLALIDELPYPEVDLVGLSFGGWLAAEVAVACRHRLRKLVLADPVGIKLSGPTTRDILDIFNTSPAAVRRAAWHDERKAPDYDAMCDEELIVHARNWESLCLYAWHPLLYNPQLKQWLGRIRLPTLVLWGDSDGIVSPDYGRAYAGLIPGARFEPIERAGHHPEHEQPDRFAERVAAFLRE